MTYTLAQRLSDIDTLVEEGVLEPSDGVALRDEALRDTTAATHRTEQLVAELLRHKQAAKVLPHPPSHPMHCDCDILCAVLGQCRRADRQGVA